MSSEDSREEASVSPHVDPSPPDYGFVSEARGRLLAQLGVSSAAEYAYFEALANGGIEGLPPRLVDELREARLLTLDADGRPVLGSAAAILDAESERLHDLARTSLRLSVEVSAIERGRGDAIETSSTPGRIVKMYSDMLNTASVQLRGFNRGPFLMAPSAEQSIVLGNGIVQRVLYETAALRIPNQFEAIVSSIRQGEDARYVDALPLRMVIADTSAAMLIREGHGGIVIATKIVDHDTVAALADVFEATWRVAYPILDSSAAADSLDEASREVRRMLGYMAKGLNDEQVAGAMGISVRTVRRWLQRLERQLDANSRFELAMRVTQLGWIDPV